MTQPSARPSIGGPECTRSQPRWFFSGESPIGRQVRDWSSRIARLLVGEGCLEGTGWGLLGPNG